MRILPSKTTCDETAAAVVTDELEVLSSVVASQDDLHQRFGGVVPEIAARAHVERILPVIDEALRGPASRWPISTPSPSPIRRGWPARCWWAWWPPRRSALALGMPLVAINHLHAHIYACRMAAGRMCFPASA